MTLSSFIEEPLANEIGNGLKPFVAGCLLAVNGAHIVGRFGMAHDRAHGVFVAGLLPDRLESMPQGLEVDAPPLNAKLRK